MKLWKVTIKTYYYGIYYYVLYVLANNESNMLSVVSERISKDDDAEIQRVGNHLPQKSRRSVFRIQIVFIDIDLVNQDQDGNDDGDVDDIHDTPADG